MNIASWFYYLLPQGIFLAVVAFFGRTLIEKWVTHAFDNRSERFKSELNHLYNQKDRLLTSILDRSSNRSGVLVQEKIDAIKGICEGTAQISRWSMAPMMLCSLELEIINKSSDPSVKKLFEFIAKSVNIDNESLKELPKGSSHYRLFLNDRTWKLYQAYSGIIGYSILLISAHSFGVSKILKEPDINRPIVDLFPTTKEYFEEKGVYAALHWVTFIYDQLFESLKLELEDKNIDSFANIDAKELLYKVNMAFEKEKSSVPEVPK